MRRWFTRFKPLVFLFLLAGAQAAETDPDGKLYLPSDDAVADVEAALVRATDNDRLVLVVLGANWCHDSRALAARLNRAPLAESARQNYELVMVDVGFLDKGAAVLGMFDVPNFYATPTVLIVDPVTRRVINDEDRHIWGNAYNISMSSSVAYFERWAEYDVGSSPTEYSVELAKLYADIQDFERQQAKRVSAGYAIVGPMLAAYKAGDAPADFDARWDELRDFRMSIPKDVRELQQEAAQRVSAGDQNIELAYPEHDKLSWEND